MAPKKIPDRWLDYRPVKDIFSDARLVPFKTPLPANKFDSPHLFDYRWTVNDVLNCLPRLGLIIDFTNKYPAYYNREDFTTNGVDYIKIGCVGHDVPNENCFREFYNVVETFSYRNSMNDRIIGIHCTHGVNRTGYMLCRYLIQKLGYQPEQAVQVFAEKRGYPIERESYVLALKNLA